MPTAPGNANKSRIPRPQPLLQEFIHRQVVEENTVAKRGARDVRCSLTLFPRRGEMSTLPGSATQVGDTTTATIPSGTFIHRQAVNKKKSSQMGDKECTIFNEHVSMPWQGRGERWMDVDAWYEFDSSGDYVARDDFREVASASSTRVRARAK